MAMSVWALAPAFAGRQARRIQETVAQHKVISSVQKCATASPASQHTKSNAETSPENFNLALVYYSSAKDELVKDGRTQLIPKRDDWYNLLKNQLE
jgi:hypothetical protein